MTALFVLAPLSVHAADLPTFVTAKARAACESDVRRLCVRSSNVKYSTVKACVKKHWDKLSDDCQYEIVSLLPKIEEYEKRKRLKSE